MTEQAGTSTASNLEGIFTPGSSTGCPVRRRQGTVNQGSDYEKFMLLWVLVGLLEDADIQDFHVADNVEGLGAFDDIIIKVKRNVPGENRTAQELICVQLKHKENFEKKIPWQEVTGYRKNPFQLQRYYEEYKNTMSGSIGKFEDPILDECCGDEITLVLYTNASFEFEEDHCGINPSLRKLLESQNNSTVFDFSETKLNDSLWTKLAKNNSNLCSEKQKVQKFLNKFVIFSKQCNTTSLKEKLNNKLSRYFPVGNVSLDHALQRAVEFTAQNNCLWLSRNSGVLHDIIFKYQGVPVRLIDTALLWETPTCQEEEASTITRKNEKLQFMNKIIVQYMCQDKENEYVCLGKELKSSEPYYVDRNPINTAFYVKDTLNSISISDESLVLLCGGPGMGKTSYFVHQAKLLKDKNPQKFIIIENLVDFSKYLRDLDVNENHKVAAENFLLEISGAAPGTAEHDLFLLCLRGRQMMTIFLDGVDEISPDYYNKIIAIIQTIRAEFNVQLWISTRPIVQERMEEDLEEISWILKKFNLEEAKKFMQIYCGIHVKLPENLKRIPIFCKMFGDVVKTNTVEDLNDVTNEVELYDKFVDFMYDVYHQDKYNSDMSVPAIKRAMEKLKKIAMEDHEVAALLEVFDEEELSELNWDIREQCKGFLEDISKGEEKAGLIVNIVGGKPRFIHRTVAEYFCGRWFSKNHDKYKQYVDKFNRFPYGVDFYMTYKLDNLDHFLKLILLKEKQELKSILEVSDGDVNVVDPLGRSVLYFVDYFLNDNDIRYNIIGKLKLKEDIVQNMNYLTGATECSLNFHLLSHFLNCLDSYSSPQHQSLIGLLLIYVLNCESERFSMCESIKPYFLTQWRHNSPLHVVIIERSQLKPQQEKSKLTSLVLEGNINSRNDVGLTPLHLAVVMKDIAAVQLLCQRGAHYTRDNELGVYPHQLSNDDNTRSILKEFYCHSMNEDNLRANIITEDYVSQNLPLHDAVQKNDLDRVKSETERLNCVDSRGRTALHVAAVGETHPKIYEHLFSRNIPYRRDEDGFYAHDYSTDLKRSSLQAYGVNSYLAKLPNDQQKIFGKYVKDVVFDLKHVSMFKRGVRGKFSLR